MRLVYVTVSMPFGANEEFLISEVRELLRLGHEVLVVPRSPSGAVLHSEAVGLELRSLKRPLLSPSVLLWAALEVLTRPRSVIRSLSMMLRSGDAKVLAKNLLVFPKGLWLARAARKWRADHLHAHWGLTTATMAMVAGEVSEIPWSLTLHRGDIATPNLLGTKTDRAAFVRYISRSGRRFAAGLGAHEHPGKACVVHMGVALPKLAASRAGNVPCVILCPAHLYPVKGHRYLLEAMATLRDRSVPCVLRLAGEGGLRDELEDQVARLGLGEIVSFLGHVAHESILGWFRDGMIDVVVLPSVDLGHNLHEGIPVALMEAMAYGIPVISTATGGIPELLHDGAGMMVYPQDSSALAEALEQLIRDFSRRERLGRAGRRRIEESFAVERTAAELAARIVASTGSLSVGPT